MLTDPPFAMHDRASKEKKQMVLTTETYFAESGQAHHKFKTRYIKPMI
jgi:hypothetical protein